MSDPDWYAADSPAKAAALAELLEDSGVRPATILDVGCGAGGVLVELVARTGAVGTGIDVHPEAIRLALQHEGPEWVVGELADSGLQAELVLCVDVFEHVEDDLGFLRELGRHGELFAFRIPLDDSVWDRIRGRTAAFRERYGHLHAYTRRRALARLEEAGFEPLAERYHRIEVGGRLSRRIRRVAGRVAPHGAARWIGGWSLLVLARSVG